jgi:Tfp pilus assembly protein PilX
MNNNTKRNHTAVMGVKECPYGACSRRGAFTVIVLICLLVSGMLLATLLRLALQQNRQAGYEQARLQAAWLAVSGLDRAADRLALEPDYAGETWTIEPASLGGRSAGTVVIRVEKAEADSDRRTVVVEAVYPAEGPHQARLTRQATFSIPKES